MTHNELIAAITAAEATIETLCLEAEEHGLNELIVHDMAAAILMGHSIVKGKKETKDD
jgi:hypothetical protein